MERACTQIWIVHIQQPVLNRVVIVVKNIPDSLPARFVSADVGSAVVVIILDNVGDARVAVKAHRVLNRLGNQRRADKAAASELARTLPITGKSSMSWHSIFLTARP